MTTPEKGLKYISPKGKRETMDARTQELLDRLVAPGQFPNMSCSEGHELYEGITGHIRLLERALVFARNHARIPDAIADGEAMGWGSVDGLLNDAS
jgi:hypothetical protein